jgi:hypothetical protein
MAALGVGFAVGWYLGDLDPVVFSAQAALFGSVVMVVTLISLIDVAAPGRTDSGKSEVLGFRVRLARLSVGIICLSAVLIGGSDALIRVGPAACALAATALMALASTVGVVKTGSDS